MADRSSKPWRIAFAGFRHGHIMSLYDLAQREPRMQLVAACEPDAAAADAIRRQGKVQLTHPDLKAMLAGAQCDIIAIGDYFAARGGIAIAALQAGKHVIADKPLCTSLDELRQIEKLSRDRKLSVGCMLDMRGSAAVRTLRRLILAGEIGDVHTIVVTGQHPLLPGSRPAWYFEPGKHGGTINDIAIHAMDALPWITGRRIVRTCAARVWNARAPEHPHFKDAAQFMLQLDNGGGILGDVSYLAPDGCGYSAPQYWRLTCHGTGGVAEIAGDSRPLILATHADKSFREITLDPPRPNVAIYDFLDEIEGASGSDSPLTTPVVLQSSRQALEVQKVADAGM